MLTLVPWHGRALIGTSQSAGFVAPSALGVTAAEVQAFIEEANYAFPALKLTRDDVTLVHRGLVPAIQTGNGVALRPESEIVDHTRHGAAGAFTIIGVKYTTARASAERVVERAAKQLGKRLPPSRTAVTTLPGAGIADHEALAIETARGLAIELPLNTLRHLIAKYAEASADIIRLTEHRPEWREPLSAAVPTLAAEVVYTIRSEQAVHLTDIAIRRTGLGALGAPDDSALQHAGSIAAGELGWSEAQREAEIAETRRFYRVD
jgi:glycerol-3-phosphate dehydrogenase